MAKSQQIQLVLLTFVLFYTIGFSPASLCAKAAAPEPSFTYTPAGQSVSIQDTVVIHILIKWQGTDEAYRFALPSLETKNFELLRIGQAIKKEADFITKEFEYEFKPLQIGTASIPDFKIPYTCSPDCEEGSIAISGKSFRIISAPKSRALWKISLIIFGVFLPVFLLLWQKLRKRSDDSTRSNAPELDAEARFFQALNDISHSTSLQGRIDALSKLFDRYEKEKKFKSTQPSDARAVDELDDILLSLKKLKFSGSAIGDREYGAMLDRIKLFVQRNQIIGPS